MSEKGTPKPPSAPVFQGKRKLVGYVLGLGALVAMGFLGADAQFAWPVVAMYGAFAGTNTLRKFAAGDTKVEMEAAKDV